MDKLRVTVGQSVICPKKVGGRVCEYMDARTIYNVLTQGRTVQKGGLNPNPLGKSHPAVGARASIWFENWGVLWVLNIQQKETHTYTCLCTHARTHTHTHIYNRSEGIIHTRKF